jgi:hypothetical protein
MKRQLIAFEQYDNAPRGILGELAIFENPFPLKSCRNHCTLLVRMKYLMPFLENLNTRD